MIGVKIAATIVITTSVLCCDAAAAMVRPLAAWLLAGKTDGYILDKYGSHCKHLFGSHP